MDAIDVDGVLDVAFVAVDDAFNDAVAVMEDHGAIKGDVVHAYRDEEAVEVDDASSMDFDATVGSSRERPCTTRTLGWASADDAASASARRD